MVIETLIMGGLGIVGVFAVNKYMISECKRKQLIMEERLEKHGDDLVSLNTRAELAVTAKDVDDKFVSKELFRQFEKHMDSRFDLLEAGQGQILNHIQNSK